MLKRFRPTTSMKRSTTLVRFAKEYSNSSAGGNALCPKPG
jgi:hypothetical protein